jgi:hypothetical protein
MSRSFLLYANLIIFMARFTAWITFNCMRVFLFLCTAYIIVLVRDVFHIGLVIGPRTAVLA